MQCSVPTRAVTLPGFAFADRAQPAPRRQDCALDLGWGRADLGRGVPDRAHGGGLCDRGREAAAGARDRAQGHGDPLPDQEDREAVPGETQACGAAGATDPVQHPRGLVLAAEGDQGGGGGAAVGAEQRGRRGVSEAAQGLSRPGQGRERGC
eukprot:3702726-Rhodomonas_salina.2